MEGLIRKTFMTVAGALMTTSAALAGTDRPIEVSQLPEAAQTVVNKNFATRQVAMAKIDDGLFYNGYEVVFTNGDKVEFDNDGQWKDVTCRRQAVPPSLVPKAIRTYMRSHYAGNKILEIEKKRNGYEVKLDNGLEIKFNKEFKVTDIDD